MSYSAAAPVTVPVATGGGSAAAAAPVSALRRAPAEIDPAESARAFFAANAPITTQPQAAGLVPEVSRALSPVVLPLLGSAAALGIAIVAVLSMMQALPWQRSSPSTGPSRVARP